MLRPCFLLVLFLFAAGLEPARAQSFAWAKVARGALDSPAVQLQASATDATGNTYVAVQFRDSLRAGSTFFTTLGSRSVGLIKYDSTGVLVWAKLLRNLTLYKLAADNSTGSVYLTAAVNSTGGGVWDGNAVALAANAAFYAKFSAASALLWTQPLPVYPSPYNGPSVVADAAGNAYVMGTATSNTTYNGVSLLQGQVLFFKINGAGSAQWTQVMHGSLSNSLYADILGARANGGCLISGNAAGPLYLGPGTTNVLLTARPEHDYFVSSFDANGAHQWSTPVGSAAAGTQALGRVGAVTADASDNCYATGTAYNGLPLGGSLANGFFLVKYDAAGALQWARSVPNTNGASVLAVGSTGPTVVIGTYVQNGQAAPLAGTLPLRAPANIVHYTAQGLEQWAAAGTWAPASPYFYPAGLGRDARGNLYPVGMPQFARFRGSPATIPAILLGAQTALGNGAIVARLNTYANTLRGQVYFDLNGNGQQDAGEGAFPRQPTALLVQGGATAYTAVSTTGELQAYANPGAYSLSVGLVPASYTLSQPAGAAYTGTFSGHSQLVSGLNFGIAPIANRADVRVSLTPYSLPRAGLTTRYRVTLENVGTTTVPAGLATLTLDSHMAYISSMPAGTVAGQTITLSYASLAPFGQLHYDMLFSLPTNTGMGTVLTTTATAPLAGDVAPADNTATLAQTVVAAYDPNAIEVNYERLTPTQVAARQPLDYTIHFQNLGTASAQNVLISDTLDFRKLDPASLLLVAQSHNCSWSLSSTGPGTGLLTVRFLGINLPERNVDVIRSQGFVRFRVLPRPTLTVGEIIPNHAGIVFDYNSPVLTNTAITAVLLPTAALARHAASAWTAYPNPTTDALTVALDLPAAGLLRLELLDALGRPVRRQTLAAPAGPLRQALDLRGLAPGVYVLRLTPPTGPATTQRVVRQ